MKNSTLKKITLSIEACKEKKICASVMKTVHEFEQNISSKFGLNFKISKESNSNIHNEKKELAVLDSKKITNEENLDYWNPEKWAYWPG